LERERGVLLEEIRSHDDDPEQCAHDLFAEGLWDPPHPLGRPVLGDRPAVARLSREVVAEQHRRQYVPSNMVAVLCGAVSGRAAAAALADRIDGRPRTPFPRKQPFPRMRPGERVYRRRSTQVHLYLALPGPSAASDDRFALEVLNAILGDGLSSRLFQRIREERGLAYVVSSAVSRYRDAGVWTFYAGVAPSNAARVRQLIVDELRSVQRDGVGDDELRRAKSRIRGHFLLSQESNGNRMVRLGSAVAGGCDILSPEAVVERFERVGMAALEATIERYVRPSQLHCAQIGPLPRRAARRRTAPETPE
jgi:predicted Zn-dependent peptidase